MRYIFPFSRNRLKAKRKLLYENIKNPINTAKLKLRPIKKNYKSFFTVPSDGYQLRVITIMFMVVYSLNSSIIRIHSYATYLESNQPFTSFMALPSLRQNFPSSTFSSFSTFYFHFQYKAALRQENENHFVDEGTNKRRAKREGPNNILIKINGWKIVAGFLQRETKERSAEKGQRT